MRTMSTLCCALLLFFGCTSQAQAQSSLREAVKDIPVAEHWIYDDLPRAVEEAKRSGKPLLVVLRCVPCPPGKALDEAVATPSPQLAEVEKQFVCVRVIKTNGLDLDLFQYDFDMSWSCMFFNASDMTIYGRFGTRYSTGKGSDANLTVAAFQKAAERVLALHKEYPANKSALAGKTGKPVEWKKPELTPGLTEYPTVVTKRQECIHCHMVKEHALRTKWQQGKLTETDLFLFPAPAQVGLKLDVDDGLKVDAVSEGAPAAAAGAKVGDVLVAAGGQPLVSTADLTWVLHTSPSETTLPVVVRRGSENVELKLTLEGDWKRNDIGWRASSWFALRQGFKTEPLAAEVKKSRGLAADELALEVKGLYGKSGPHLKKFDLKQGDVIVGVDGRSDAMSESEFLVQLRTKHGPNDTVKLTILRGGERKELNIPLW